MLSCPIIPYTILKYTIIYDTVRDVAGVLAVAVLEGLARNTTTNNNNV